MSSREEPATTDRSLHRAEIPEALLEAGGLKPGASRAVSNQTGIPEADIYGVGSFFHLLAEPHIKVRICQGLSCQMAGSEKLLQQAKAAGLPAAGCSCLAACDRPVAALRDRTILPDLTEADLERAGGNWKSLQSEALGTSENWKGVVGPTDTPREQLVIDLLGDTDFSGHSLARAQELGPDGVIEAIETSGLQGRGGAGFPAGFKWKAVRSEARTPRYLVLNADEGEPGTFKDREVLLRRPDRVVEGLLIAARTVGAQAIYCYLRGEFGGPWRALETAFDRFEQAGLCEGICWHLHAGHGAYICGEETALLEALEGKRGMPRLKPPFPTQVGLWGQPTLIHNVETIACVPEIVLRGGEWFANLGRTGPGTKLYCVSGDVEQPGTYELPLGISLDELLQVAGGMRGTLRAFSPGGASSGFLPASERHRPLDFQALKEVDTMLGSAGVVVLNDQADLAQAVRAQLEFFAQESCGQCAPCRIGTRFQARNLATLLANKGAGTTREQIQEVAWEMNEGSICGLGQIASLPLTSALRWFPEVFEP